MSNWKYTNASNRIVGRINADGSSESCIVEAIADWLAAGNTPEPADLPPKATADQMWDAIKAAREQRKVAGVKVGTKWFHSDDASKIQQMALLMLGAAMPAGLQWKTMDGTFVAMTPTLAQQIFAAEVANDQALFAAAEAHNAAMLVSAEPSAYDFSIGWPATFAP